MIAIPTPHLEKLNATIVNAKLPDSDKPRLEEAIDRYKKWIGSLTAVKVDEKVTAATERTSLLCQKMVSLLIDYKKYIDIDLIFDSPNDFLYRQRDRRNSTTASSKSSFLTLFASACWSSHPTCQSK